MLKTTNAEFSFIEIWLTDQNNKSLEIEDDVNITLIISIKMRYSLELTYRRYVQGYGFLSFARKFRDNFGKKLMNTAYIFPMTFFSSHFFLYLSLIYTCLFLSFLLFLCFFDSTKQLFSTTFIMISVISFF